MKKQRTGAVREMSNLPPMITFAAPSGTGKTTLMERVIKELQQRGYRVGALKHDAHRLRLDTPGKDSWRLRQAGAWRVAVASHDQLGIFSSMDGDVSLTGFVERYLCDVDVVFTEGFRQAELPTFRVHRAAHRRDQGWQEPRNVVAVVTDAPDHSSPVPQLPLNNPSAVADFVENQWLVPSGCQRRVTAVLPIAANGEGQRRLHTARAVFGDDVLAITAPGVHPPSGVRSVADIRPGLGPLGALLTGLAAVETEAVLFWGLRHRAAPPTLWQGLLNAAPSRADVVPLVHRGRREPLAALYSHRCLSAIQAALLGGERRMDGWWGQVWVHAIPEQQWKAWDPEGLFASPS